MTNVCVTGADGFIGSHLVEALVHQGYKVKALVQYNSFANIGWLSDLQSDILETVDICSGDIRDRSFINNFCFNADIVFHLAALIGIPYSYVAPQSYVDTNITGTLNILEAQKASEHPFKLISTSTSETYGSAQYVPIDELHPLVGQSPYSATKIAADQLCISYAKSFGLPITILRPFNTYGPRQSTRAVIPTIIRQLLTERIIKLGSLSPTRDFNYVSDTASAFIELSKAPFDRIKGEVFNSASNYEISILDTLKTISNILDIEPNLVEDSSRIRPKDSEVFRLFGSADKLQSLTGWKPKYNGLDGFTKGLELTCNWFSDPKNLQKYPSATYQV